MRVPTGSLHALLLCLAAGLALADRGPAQKLAWRLPPRGVACYQRTQEADPPRMLVQNRHVPGFGICNPAVLLQSELDPSQRYPIGDPASLWELAMHLAFDLRTATGKAKIDRTYGFLCGFGSVRVRGTAGPVEAGGAQQLTLKVTRAPLPPKDYPARVLEHLEQANANPLDAGLTIRRTIDVANGRIAGFDSVLEGSVGTRLVRLSEKWRFQKTRPNRYPTFRSDVARAIRIGANYIKTQIADPNGGAIAAGADGQGRTVGTGLLALVLLTLIHADVPAEDPVVARGLAALRSREITDTYSAALAIMALEALHAPRNERQMLIEGRIEKPIPRKPGASDRALIRKWANRILHNADAGGHGPPHQRRFSYTAGAKFYDNSNTQYAALGLYSAHLCGVDFPPSIWHAMGNHWLSDQLADGKPLRLKLVSHTAYARQRQRAATERQNGRTTGRPTVARGRKVQPAGWPYTSSKGARTIHTTPLTGSMTCAGITGLTICEAVLRSHAKLPKFESPEGSHETAKTVLRRYAEARQLGYAWMLDNYSVRVNKHKEGFGFHFYYLYGLERACEIGQIALIGEHDWYFEGATMLLGMQRPQGNFALATLYANCFAILFLKQAAPPLPASTGKRPGK